MPLSWAVFPGSLKLAAGRGVAIVCGAALTVLPGCASTDRAARQDVESLQTNVEQMDSSLQGRMAGVYEQIRELREEQNRLERLLEESGRQAKAAGVQVERLRERTQEELNARDKMQRENAQSVTDQLSRLAARVDGLHKDLQKGFQTLNDNLVAMSDFEKKQEERIARIQEQFQAQLKVVVEEVGQENQGLARSIAATRADVETIRQESATTRQGLVDLHEPLRQIAERLATAQGQIQDLTRRQDTTRKAAPPRARQHTVRVGESLTTIAARYGISVQALMEKNQITDPNSIREGQKLAIPEP